jgi:hypothetical protein
MSVINPVVNPPVTNPAGPPIALPTNAPVVPTLLTIAAFFKPAHPANNRHKLAADILVNTVCDRRYYDNENYLCLFLQAFKPCPNFHK